MGLNVWVRSPQIFDDGFYAGVAERLALRSAHRVTLYQNNGIKRDLSAEAREIQDFEGRGRRKGLTPVATLTTEHNAHLARQFGEHWHLDKKAISRAAEVDPSVHKQRRAMEYAADAVRANS